MATDLHRSPQKDQDETAPLVDSSQLQEPPSPADPPQDDGAVLPPPLNDLQQHKALDMLRR